MKKQTLEKNLEYVTDGYFALLCTLFLFAIPTEGYSNLVSLKYGLFLCICGGYILLSWAIYLETVGLSGTVSSLKGSTLFQKPVFPFLVAYLGLTLLSALCSVYDGIFLGGFRYEGVLTISIYVLSSLLVMSYYRSKPWHLALLGVSITGFCFVGMVQLLGYNPLGLFPEPYNFFAAGIAYDGVYWSTIGNVNLCAAILSSGVAIFSVALIKFQEKSVLLSLVPLFCCSFSAFAVKSESTILAIAGGLLLLLPLSVTNLGELWRWLGVCGIFLTGGLLGYAPWLGLSPLYLLPFVLGVFFLVCPPNSRPLGKILVLPVIILPLLALLVLYLVPFSSGTLYELHEILHGRVNDTFGTGRFYLWQQVWQEILETPWLGGGADSLGARDLWFITYADPEETIELRRVVIDHAHNEFLNIWVNQGIFALIAYLGFLGSCFWALLKHRKHLPTLIAGSVILLYQIQAQFGITMMITAPYFWLAVGILHQNTIKKEKNT